MLDDDILNGPQDGDVFSNEPPAEPPQEPIAAEPAAPDPLDTLRAEMEEMRNQLELAKQERDMLHRGDNLNSQNAQDEEALAAEFANFEQEFYTNPQQAMRSFADNLEKRIETKLTSRYQQERGQDDFWRSFYAANPDLQSDDDVVKMVLNANVATLGNMPVPEASRKLADLTRDRLLRIAGGEKKPGARPKTEGAQPVGDRAAPVVEEPKVSTLSDFLRQRRSKRAGAVAE